MKLIISRKGVDSSAGGFPSPILPDGTMFSIPIPESGTGRVTYADLRLEGHELGEVVSALSRRKSRQRYDGSAVAHHDPDLVQSARNRPLGWRPAFGQSGVHQTLLENRGVQCGDVFLFFGWFKRVERGKGGEWQFVRRSPELHVLWGWLQVETVLKLPVTDKKNEWAWDHVHAYAVNETPNVLYVGRDELQIDGKKTGLPGSGVFPRFNADLQLTAAGRPRSYWRLPDWFHPAGKARPLGFHDAGSRWSEPSDGTVQLKTVGRGQEFVLDCDAYPKAMSWVHDLVRFGVSGEGSPSHSPAGSQ